ncbi:hypothetical protein PoB_002791200 [Plakobranchus ocellatus]|uniref:SMB domain-containing protein n=1 Tax=Plakobranchus ocellatus TaxID=259542 RepID=A0AAV4A3H2_9GAST|nr:hypothetical protein PoB_002791200 [Plakobranchus ocellatus]
MAVLATTISNQLGASPMIHEGSITNPNTATEASETPAHQTNSEEAESELPAHLNNTSFGGPTSSRVTEKSGTSLRGKNLSCLATNKVNNSKIRSAIDLSEGVKVLDFVASGDLLDEPLVPVCDNDTMNRPDTDPHDVGFGPRTSVNSTGTLLHLTFTCEGQCGKRISFPCSCSATCVVYGTCCDNMASDCPHVWEEGLSRFDHIRRADIICSEDSIYMISSCPVREIGLESMRKRAMKKESMDLETNGRFSHGVSSTLKTENITQFNSSGENVSNQDMRETILKKLNELFLFAPVTDSETGLTFIDRTIYDCNNMSERNALTWSVRLDYNFINPTTMEEVDVFKTSYKYRPEFNKEILEAHLCLNVIDECSPAEDFEELRTIYADKCQKSFAAVTSRFESPIYYQNIFCAYCNKHIHSRYRLIVTNSVMFKESALQVLMSFSTSNTISLRLNKSPEMSRATVPWSYAQCSIPLYDFSSSLEPRNLEADRKSVCSVTCEGPFFTLQSDGICKAQHTAFLAITDDGLPPLCSSAVENLGKFLVCSLKNEVESLRYADLSSRSITAMFDMTMNTSLYVVELDMALPQLASLIFSDEKKDSIQNIQHLAIIWKVLKDYRLSQNLCPRQDRDTQKPNSNLRVIQTQPLGNFFSMLTLPWPQVMEEFRGPVVNNQNTTVCLSTTELHRSDNNGPNTRYIYCMDDPEYERDASLARRFRSSPCLSYLNEIEIFSNDGVTNNAMGNKKILFKCVLSLNILVVIFIHSVIGPSPMTLIM